MSADLVRSPSGDVLRARDVLRDAQRRPDWALADGLSGRGPLPAGWAWVEVAEPTPVDFDGIEGFS